MTRQCNEEDAIEIHRSAASFQMLDVFLPKDWSPISRSIGVMIKNDNYAGNAKNNTLLEMLRTLRLSLATCV